MQRDLILGTAGHIDHGKTSLIKVLTGIDCDRLPEEKQRGITIDIGFAHLLLENYRIGIVDCPGHERFIKNMLAGTTGIDLALLVVAADDSIMPQTREHLEILNLLGIQHGIIAITKCDLVDSTTLELVQLEMQDLVKGTFLQDAPIIQTSAQKGIGIQELRQAILRQANQKRDEHAGEWFRLAIDRAFVVQGHGTVVTGSVTSGSLRVGEEIEWLPSKASVRVRSLHNHDQVVDEVHRGQRAAINLAGISLDQVWRGQELAKPGYLQPTRVLSIYLQPAKSIRKPLKHRTPVRVHLGTMETTAILSLLDCDQLQSGQWGLAQLFLDDPVVAIWNQPLILRDSSAEHTLGGAKVLQPNPVKIRRRHFSMLERMEKLIGPDPLQRILAVAWFAEQRGVERTALIREAGIVPTEVDSLLQKLVDQGQLVEIVCPQKRFIHPEWLKEWEQRILTALKTMHHANPLMTSHDRLKVIANFGFLEDDPFLQYVVDLLIKNRSILGDAKRIADAEFKPKLSNNQRKLKDKVVETHRLSGFTPPEPSSFTTQAGGNVNNLKDIFEVAVAEGWLIKIHDDFYLHSESESRMRERIAEAFKGRDSGLTVAEIRDLLGTTRKYAVPLCEYLDRIGFTRREGDLRLLNPDQFSQQPTPSGH